MVHDQLPLHLIGTQAFLPAVLSHIRNAASPASLPLDQVIFQSLLLCLIAQDKHLIIRTPEEDVGLAVKLTVWTLTSVFNISTHKVKLRHAQKPAARPSTPSSSNPNVNNTSRPADSSQETFLRSLFLPSSSLSAPSSNSNQTSQDEGSTSTDGHARSHSSHGHAGGSHKQTSKHSRPRSFPNNLAAAAHSQMQTNGGHGSDLLMQPVPHTESITATSISSSTTASPSILNPRPMYAYPKPTYGQSSPRLPHAYTDPFPIPTRSRKKTRSQSYSIHEQVRKPKKLPNALIISGLENASIAVQRTLAGVLGDRKVVLDNTDNDGEPGLYTLPDGFICVYICPWNARERPAVHKTLLDKFAMSTNVFIPQNIRNDFHLLPFAMSAGSSPRPVHPNFSYSNPGSPSAPQHAQLPPTQTPPVYSKALPGHEHGHLSHPHSHHHPPQRTVTHFPLSTPPSISIPLPHMHSLPSSITHQQGPSTPSRLPLLLPSEFLVALRAAFHQTHVAPTLDFYLCDLMSATRHDSRLDGTLLTARSIKDARDLVRASRVVGTDLTGMELVRPEEEEEDARSEHEEDEEEFHSTRSKPDGVHGSPPTEPIRTREVAEVDIARIFPRIVSHRVRLRDGPDDEILSSAMFGATFKPPLPAHLDKTSQEKAYDSVKSVLVSILSEV